MSLHVYRWIVTVFVLALASTGIGCDDVDRAALAAARSEFHRRFAAQQFQEIYDNRFTDPTRGGHLDPVMYSKFLGRIRRDSGVFEQDGRRVIWLVGNQNSDGYVWVREAFNCRYTNWPAVEYFNWRIKDNVVYLDDFNLRPNSELRCEGEVVDCTPTQLGPVLPTKAF